MNLDTDDSKGVEKKSKSEKPKLSFKKIKYFDLKFDLRDSGDSGDLWVEDSQGNAYVFSKASIQSAIETIEEIYSRIQDVQEACPEDGQEKDL